MSKRKDSGRYSQGGVPVKGSTMGSSKGAAGSNKGAAGSNKGAAGLGKKPRPQRPSKPSSVLASPASIQADHEQPRNRPRAPEPTYSQVNRRLGELVINRMSHDGRGIAEWNHKTLFVDGALAGERIQARLVADHSRYAEARVDQVLEPSAYRQIPPCPHYSQCGGCSLQHVQSAHQLELKQAAILEQLARWGGVVPQRVAEPIASATTGYRRVARLGVWYESGGTVTLGFRERHSNNLVQIDTCLVLTPALERLLAPLAQWLAGLQVQAVTHVELMDSQDGAAVIVRHTKKLAEVDLHRLADVAATYAVKVWLQSNHGKALQDMMGTPVDPRLVYSVPGFDLSMRFHPLDFIQVNASVNERMIAQAIDWLALTGVERVLDLFCGIGNFTLPIARHAAQVIGMEAVDAMVERGRENALAQHIPNAQFMAADLAKTSVNRLRQTCGHIDALLLDPPRDGAKGIIAKLHQLAPKRIVYVSCNPATLARDAKVLAETGYRLASVGVMDMFPHTDHIESMALFLRDK